MSYFPVFTLGQSYGGYAFGAATLQLRKQQSSTDGATQVELYAPIPRLRIGYVDGSPFDRPTIELTQRGADAEIARSELARFRAEGVRRTATIAGAPRDVYILDEGQPAVYYAVVVPSSPISSVPGSTLVSGRAALPASDLLTALGNLSQVN